MTQTLKKPEYKEKAPGKSARLTHRPWWRHAIELGLAFSVGFLLLEGVFNFAGVGNEEFLEPDPVLGVRHIAGKKVVWRLEGYSDEHLSSAGLRDSEHAISKPAGVYRIALLGDSATEGMQVALAETYGKQLEKLLNQKGLANGQSAEVINFGCSSYSNGQEVLQLEKQVAMYNPDLVIMMYNRGDYIENIRDPSTMKAEPRPYFHMDASAGNLLQDNTIMEFNKKSFEANPVQDFLRRNSRIYGVLTHTNLALSLNEQLYSKLRNSILKLLPGSKDNWKRVTPPYTISDPWQVTEKLIERANDNCTQMGSKFMLVCFPNIVNDKEYANQIEALQAQSHKLKYQFLDLTSDFRQNPNANGLFLKYHFSAAGHRLAAEKIRSNN